MNTDLQPLRPYLDNHSCTVAAQATRQLGFLRGYRGPGVPRGFRTVGPIGWAVWNRRDGDYEA
jgi:hypothetical protein